MAKKKTVTEETIKEEVIDASNVQIDVDALSESLNEIDTTIPFDKTEIKNLENQIISEVKPLQDIQNKITEITTSQENFSKMVSENPENVNEIISKEIEKVETLKTEVEKIIKTNTNNKINVTNWWNGMGYDF